MSAGPRVPYAGVATRAVALAIDAVLSQGIFIVGAALLGLAGSLVGELRPAWLVPILAGAGWVVTGVAYFAGFWSATGQTPGMRLMHLRVVGRDGAPPHVARALLRLVGLVLAIVPVFAGFIPVLIDDRRRGLPDFLAGTFVLYADRELVATELERRDVSLAASDMSGQPG
jgi:uncharacterized RDD family membrane protein YckC